MRKPLFLNLIAAASLVVAAALVLGATLGPSGAQLRAEKGSRPTEAMELPPPATGEVLATGLPDFSRLVEHTNPAVVTITNRQYRTVDEIHEGIDPFRFFRERFRDPEDDGDDAPRRELAEGGGSGFVIAANGYILTNNHVIEDADSIWVDLEDGRTIEAYVMGADRHIDVALLKIDAEGLPALPLGDSDALRVGEWVVAIGSPMSFDHTVTAGVVSAKGRDVPLTGVDRGLSEFIQTDAAINFGNSGGPLLNVNGEVVGINTAITRQTITGDPRLASSVVQGIGFALPINQVRQILDQLQSTGHVERGYMGVSLNTMQTIGEDNWKVFGLPGPYGALIADVEKGQPAAEAGLKPGDVIVEVEGERVAGNQDLIRRVSSRRPGDRIRIGVIRYREPMSFEVILGDRRSAYDEPEPTSRDAVPGAVPGLGFEIGPIDEGLRRDIGQDDLEGVLVTRVDPESPAYEAGLREGMLIVEVDRRGIDGPGDFERAMAGRASGDAVSLRVAVPSPGGGVGYQFVVIRVP